MTKELANDLRKAALEIAAAGHAGWGNACSAGADAIEAMQARVADQSAQLTRHTNLIDQLQEERCKLAAELAALRAKVVRMNDALLRGVLTTLEMFGLSAIDLTAHHAKVYEIAAPIPPVREPLTDAQIQSLWDVACEDSPQKPGWCRHIRYARAVEAAIKEQAK